ncbi:MAG: phycobilisome rod-core linker polypeptide [Pseudanabaenaceae cyanobacterium]
MLPLLKIKPTTQNHRVDGYDVPDEDDPVIYRLTDATSLEQVQELIWAVYRQIFSEHYILEAYRQRFLESQLQNRQISVREFVRGVAKSEVFRRLVMATNSNYRLVDILFRRLLGRATYNQGEQIAYSIVLATQGLDGLIDGIVDGEEYLSNFGEDIVPYQRRRMNGRPFNLVTPRYSDYWRAKEAAAYSADVGVKLRSLSGNTLRVRSGIPSEFFRLANDLNPPVQNYYYAQYGGVNPSRIAVPDMSRSDRSATVKPKSAPTPYRYLPK